MATSTTDTNTTREIGIRELLEAGLHFGHQTKRWNPKMKPYIFDKRNGIHIIDLSKSLEGLRKALEFTYQLVLDNRALLFVGTKKQASDIIKSAAETMSQHYVTHRWLGGTLTNNETIRKSIKRMRELEALESGDGMASLPKKEVSSLRRELEKLRRNLSGVADMTRLPGALFVVDINREAIAVAEARKLNIPVIAIVDTNCDPDPVDYLIAGNDDAIRAIQLIISAFTDAISQAREEAAKVAAELARKAEEERKAAEKAEAEARKKREAEAAAIAAAAKTETVEKKAKTTTVDANEKPVDADKADASETPNSPTTVAPETPAEAPAVTEASDKSA